MGPMLGQASRQTSSKGRPRASGLAPRMGLKASLYRVMRAGPQKRQLGKCEASIISTATRRLVDQPLMGPRGVRAQS